jgi:hypothetical protein
MKTTFVSLMLFLSFATRASAQSDARLLASFTVLDELETTVQSAALAAAGRTTLLFLKPSCRSCEQLLGELARLDTPNLTTQLVIVIHAPLQEAAAFAARRLPVELQSVRWFADIDASAWNAMGLKGVPVLVGVENSRVAWKYSGAPTRSLLDSLMRTWLAPNGGDR